MLLFHFNIYTMAEARDFKFGTQLGFAEAHHKTTTSYVQKWVSLGVKEAPIGIPLQYFCNGRAVLLALAELLVRIGNWCHIDYI